MPRVPTVYADRGVLTPMPTRYRAAYDRRGDPRRQLLRAAYEGLEREGEIEDANAWLSAEEPLTF
mgnify:CR=1 FL=1